MSKLKVEPRGHEYRTLLRKAIRDNTVNARPLSVDGLEIVFACYFCLRPINDSGWHITDTVHKNGHVFTGSCYVDDLCFQRAKEYDYILGIPVSES